MPFEIVNALIYTKLYTETRSRTPMIHMKPRFLRRSIWRIWSQKNLNQKPTTFTALTSNTITYSMQMCLQQCDKIYSLVQLTAQVHVLLWQVTPKYKMNWINDAVSFQPLTRYYWLRMLLFLLLSRKRILHNVTSCRHCYNTNQNNKWKNATQNIHT